MRVCITLDDVIRAKTVRIGTVYKKFIDPDIDLDALEFDTNNYQKIFGFKDPAEWEKFLYTDYPFEIFGEAGVTTKGIDKELLLWHVGLQDFEDIDEPIEVFIANPFEFNASIGYTCFFLSKIATRIREFYFPLDSSTIWDKCDILITAEPKLIENKPEGKICIKIDMPYNEELKADYTYDTLSDAIKDNNFLKKIAENL